MNSSACISSRFDGGVVQSRICLSRKRSAGRARASSEGAMTCTRVSGRASNRRRYPSWTGRSPRIWFMRDAPSRYSVHEDLARDVIELATAGDEAKTGLDLVREDDAQPRPLGGQDMAVLHPEPRR